MKVDPKTWKYEDFAPDVYDFDAEYTARKNFMKRGENHLIKSKLNEAGRIQLAFSAGFYRGCKWTQDKFDGE